MANSQVTIALIVVWGPTKHKTFQDNLKNYVWTDDDHIADVFDETKTPPTGENGNQQPRRASGSSSNFNVRIKEFRIKIDLMVMSW